MGYVLRGIDREGPGLTTAESNLPEWLAARGVEPARVAWHWRRGGNPAEAERWRRMEKILSEPTLPSDLLP